MRSHAFPATITMARVPSQSMIASTADSTITAQVTVSLARRSVQAVHTTQSRLLQLTARHVKLDTSALSP